MLGSTKIAVGHNADDVAETVLMNLLRGDINRITKAGAAMTGGGEGMAARLRLNCIFLIKIIVII